MVSKELLSVIRADNHKVLNTDLNYLEEDNKIGYLLDNRQWYFINIYELAHKCKVWAHNKGYMLNTVILPADNKTWHCEDDYRKTRTTWKDDSEPLVIFKACNWILEEIKEKNETTTIH